MTSFTRYIETLSQPVKLDCCADCSNRRYIYDETTNQLRLKRCNRPKCCERCRNGWAWMLFRCLDVSFKCLPPSHHLRVLKRGNISTERLRDLAIKYLRSVRKVLPDLQYFYVLEWPKKGKPHLHAVLRTSYNWPKKKITLLNKSFGSINPGCSKIRKDHIVIARYILKEGKRQRKTVGPVPKDFKGRAVNYSKAFLVKPIKSIWKEILQSHQNSHGIVDPTTNRISRK